MNRLQRLTSLFTLILSAKASGDLKPRCGDCWCIYYNETNQCPANETGIADTFPASQFQVFSTFNLTNPDAQYLTLQTTDGQECYPFADTLGKLSSYPKSSLPKCAVPTSTSETVCAYLYEAGTQCQGRNYQILNYDSAAAAEAAGAVVTHKGGELVVAFFSTGWHEIFE